MNNFKKRKICVASGSRSEFGILASVIDELKKNNSLEIQIAVSGMHLSSRYGGTVREIKKTGLTIDAIVRMTPHEDSKFAFARSIGHGIIGFATVFKQIKPDVVLVLGDRVEALAAAITAAYMNIIVAHISGGDSARAGLDESTRHAITKFAHIHFPATQKSAERIHKMGEDSWRIHLTGSPSVDGILRTKLLSKKDIVQKYRLNPKRPFLLILQHSVSTQVEAASWQMEETLKAVASFGFQSIIIYPNADAGGLAIINVIKKFQKKYLFFQTYKNVSRRDYLSLLKTANILLGNSSSGIIESSLFHLPVIDIGIRQEGREQSTNILHVSHNSEEIKIAIHKAIFDQEFLKKVSKCQNLYGDGRASQRIVKVLSDVVINSRLIQKKIAY